VNSTKGKRVLLSGGVSAVVVGLSYGVLGGIPQVSWLRWLFGLLVYPGFKAGLAVFPEGVHAGIPFLVIAGLVNWVCYTLLLLAVLFTVSRLENAP